MISMFFKGVKPINQLFIFVALFIFFLFLSAGVGQLFVSTDPRWMLAISQIFAFLIPAFLMGVLFYDYPKHFFQLDLQWRKWVLGILAAVVIVLLIPLTDLLTSWNNAWHWSGAWEPMEKIIRQIGDDSSTLMRGILLQDGYDNLMVNLIIVALIPAVCEEFFFRAVLQQLIHRCVRNSHIAILITATIFSLAHGEIFAFLPRFFLGIILGYLFYYSQSIVVNICAHFVNNAIVVVSYFLFTQHVFSTNYAEELSIPYWGVVLFTLTALLIFKVAFLGAKNKKCPKF